MKFIPFNDTQRLRLAEIISQEAELQKEKTRLAAERRKIVRELATELKLPIKAQFHIVDDSSGIVVGMGGEYQVYEG